MAKQNDKTDTFYQLALDMIDVIGPATERHLYLVVIIYIIPYACTV